MGEALPLAGRKWLEPSEPHAIDVNNIEEAKKSKTCCGHSC